MIRILCVGKIKNKDLLRLYEEYNKRIRPLIRLELIELKDSNQEQERKAMFDYVEKHSEQHCVLLDEMGITYGSLQFSHKMRHHMGMGQDITFIIAGATGFGIEAKRKFEDKLSLSMMTFPHEMARVMLIEQIYRAFMIIGGRNYHK